MTTKLTKPVSRQTAVSIKDGGKARLLVATLHSEFIILRLAGTQRQEIISLEHAYFAAVKARVFRDKMIKAKERITRKSK